MNVGDLISLTRRRSGVENTGLQGDLRLAQELTEALREIMSEASLKDRLRIVDYTDLALTALETQIPSQAYSVVHVEDRTGLDATREGAELLRLDYLGSKIAPRMGWWTIGSPPDMRIGVRGFDWQGVTLRLYYEIDAEVLSSTTPTQVPMSLPPLHHPALALMAAMRLQAERNGEPSRSLYEEAMRRKYNAIIALNKPTSIRRT